MAAIGFSLIPLLRLSKLRLFSRVWHIPVYPRLNTSKATAMALAMMAVMAMAMAMACTPSKEEIQDPLPPNYEVPLYPVGFIRLRLQPLGVAGNWKTEEEPSDFCFRQLFSCSCAAVDCMYSISGAFQRMPCRFDSCPALLCGRCSWKSPFSDACFSRCDAPNNGSEFDHQISVALNASPSSCYLLLAVALFPLRSVAALGLDVLRVLRRSAI